MGLRINTNVGSIGAQRRLSVVNERLKSNFRKLSSGERITMAADDAAGLAISEKLKSKIRSMTQAKRNTADAISLIQTAEGGLSEISNIVIRLRELAIQSASDTVGEQERAFSDIEFQQLKEEIDRISRSNEFNGRKLLDGTGGLVDFQIGVNNDPQLDRLVYDSFTTDGTIESLGMLESTVTTKVGSQQSLGVLDNALVKVSGIRANLGALQNRLQSVIANLAVNHENLSAANSRIRDVDVASETAELTRNTVLQQAGISVLAQANASPQSALKLIG